MSSQIRWIGTPHNASADSLYQSKRHNFVQKSKRGQIYMEETRLLIKCTSFVFLATSNCGLSPKNDKLRLLDMMLQQIFYFRLKDVLLNFDFDSNKIRYSFYNFYHYLWLFFMSIKIIEISRKKFKYRGKTAYQKSNQH